MTRKNRKTHLLGFTSLMSLRESTVPQIAHTLRQQPDLPQRLKAKVERMIESAKKDVEDFYAEITFRNQRKSGGGEKRELRRDKRVKTPPPMFPQPKKTQKEEKKHDDDDEEEEEDEEIPCDEQVSEEEEKENSDADSDLFKGRFSSGSVSARSETPKHEVPVDPDLMAKTLKEMITQAVHCGALAEDPRLHMIQCMKQIDAILNMTQNIAVRLGGECEMKKILVSSS